MHPSVVATGAAIQGIEKTSFRCPSLPDSGSQYPRGFRPIRPPRG